MNITLYKSTKLISFLFKKNAQFWIMFCFSLYLFQSSAESDEGYVRIELPENHLGQVYGVFSLDNSSTYVLYIFYPEKGYERYLGVYLWEQKKTIKTYVWGGDGNVSEGENVENVTSGEGAINKVEVDFRISKEIIKTYISDGMNEVDLSNRLSDDYLDPKGLDTLDGYKIFYSGGFDSFGDGGGFCRAPVARGLVWENENLEFVDSALFFTLEGSQKFYVHPSCEISEGDPNLTLRYKTFLPKVFKNRNGLIYFELSDFTTNLSLNKLGAIFLFRLPEDRNFDFLQTCCDVYTIKEGEFRSLWYQSIAESYEKRDEYWSKNRAPPSIISISAEILHDKLKEKHKEHWSDKK